VKRGDHFSANCPPTWRKWVEKGVYTPLKAERVLEYRSKEEQLPSDKNGKDLIKEIYDHFFPSPIKFEASAAEIAKLMLKNITRIDLTRPTRDGGRDAIGQFRIGEGPSAVDIDFALEAKCYAINKPVGVKELSRLISRLRHRQFGVFVTTSYIGLQAYQEIKEDKHPIVIISAVDIVKVLKSSGISAGKRLTEWLSSFWYFFSPKLCRYLKYPPSPYW